MLFPMKYSFNMIIDDLIETSEKSSNVALTRVNDCSSVEEKQGRRLV